MDTDKPAAPKPAAPKPAAPKPAAPKPPAPKVAEPKAEKVDKPKAEKVDKPKAEKAAKKAKPVKEPKVKLARDSFTMPKDDYALIETLKTRAIHFHRPAKKSELLRAGLHALVALSDISLEAALNALHPVKMGRPKGHARKKK